MRRLAPLLSLLLVFLLGCGGPTEPRRIIRLGEPFWLDVGAVGMLADGRAAVRFVGVVGDSRCPSGAICIWQGEFTVDIGVTVPPAAERVVRLHQLSVPRDTSFGGPADAYRIEVLDVAPWPRLGVSVRAESYRAQLKLSAVPCVSCAMR